jgi:translocation and assembly module TamB
VNKRASRAILTGVGTLAGALTLAIAVLVVVLQSAWFKDQIRLRIISTTETVSGGRVEIQSFDYSWKDLTTTLRGFVVHGSEPAGGSPLFRAERIQVELRIVSFFRRDVDIQELRVDKPELYILVRPDGTTNIPAPRMQQSATALSDQLLKLAIGRFEWRDGWVQVDQQRIRADARADHLSAGIHYDPAQSAYSGQLSSGRLDIKSKYPLPVATAFSTDFVLGRDRLAIPSFSVSLSNSRLRGSALLAHFANPTVTTHVAADVDGADAARLMNHPQLKRGRVRVEGDASYGNKQYAFTGSVTGTGIEYDARAIRMKDVAIYSKVMVGPEVLSLQNVSLKALGAAVEGEARFRGYRDFEFRGRVSGLDVRELGRPALNQSLPWAGVIAGPVELKGRFEANGPRDVILNTNVGIAAGRGPTPISGNAHVQYRQRENRLQFDRVHLNLPNSSLDASGTLGDTLQISATTTNLADADTITPLFTADRKPLALPVQLDHGRLTFMGVLAGELRNPRINGHLGLERARYGGQLIESASGDLEIDAHHFKLTNGTARKPGLFVNGTGNIALSGWHLDRRLPLQASFTVRSADIGVIAAQLNLRTRLPIRGRADFSGNVAGTLENLQGSGRLHATGLDAEGQSIDAVSADLRLAGKEALVEHGSIRAGNASATFSAAYQRNAQNWDSGRLEARVETSGFELQKLTLAHSLVPGLAGHIETHFEARAQINLSAARPVALESLDGMTRFTNIRVDTIPYGQLSMTAATRQHLLDASFDGDLRESHVGGNAKVQLAGDYQAEGRLRVSAIRVSTIRSLVPGLQNEPLPVEGVIEGNAEFAGPLVRPEALTASAQLNRVEFAPQLPGADAKRDGLTLRNTGPLIATYKDKTATIQPFQMTAQDTKVGGSGRFSLNNGSPVDFRVNGDVNLQLLRIFDPTLTARGNSRLNAVLAGSLRNPTLTGSLEVHDASFYLADFSNGIDHANGLIRFDRNRATIQSFTAQSGGGNLTLSGFVGFNAGTPLVYHVDATAHGVRVRYGGVSSTFDANLRYSGTSQSSLLSGDITVMKAAFTPSTDVGRLFAATAAPVATPRAQNDFLRRIRLEVHVASSPTLQLTTSLSQDVQADIDLRLRGTPDRPAVLGRLSLTEGQIQFFGNKYTINRGEVNFYNPVKIEPVLDLNLETEARGITVSINITGTLEKLNVNYQSDPPLQSHEIIALLATGRTPDQVTASPGSLAATQSGGLAGPNTILGSAISPGSSRLQRFFGVTHLKIDPMLQGIEDVPQARLTLEQQISREITVTYVTNLSRTAEQIFRVEWALNPEYSVIAIRDENGLFGIDMQYKRRFK